MTRQRGYGPDRLGSAPLSEFPPEQRPLVREWRCVTKGIRNLRSNVRHRPDHPSARAWLRQLKQLIDARQAMIPAMRAAGFKVFRRRPEPLKGLHDLRREREAKSLCRGFNSDEADLAWAAYSGAASL